MSARPSAVSCGRAAAALLRQQCLERTTPARAQGRDAKRALQLATGVTRLVEQCTDFGYGHTLGARRDPHDLVPSLDFAFLDHTEIETGPAVRDQQRGHLRLVHANTDPVTGDARLRDFEQSAADTVTVTYAHLLVTKAVYGEILPKLSMGEVVATELALPIVIGVDLIDEDCPVLAAVPM